MDTAPPSRTVRVVLAIAGAFFVLFGLWAFAAPASFYDAVATFEPYNAHFVRDIGAFQLGLGAVLLLALLPWSAAAVALLGAGVGSLAHALGHVLDRDLGGTPATDIPTFTLVAIVLLVVGWRARGGAT